MEKTLCTLFYVYVHGLCQRLWKNELCLRSLQFWINNVYNSSFLCLWGMCTCVVEIMSTYLHELCLRSLQFWKDTFNLSTFLVYVFVCEMMSYVYVHCSLKTRMCRIHYIYVYRLYIRLLYKLCLRLFVLCLRIFMSYVYVHCSLKKTLYKLCYVYGLYLSVLYKLCLRSFFLCLRIYMSYVYVHCSLKKTLSKLYYVYVYGLCLCVWSNTLCLRSLQF